MGPTSGARNAAGAFRTARAGIAAKRRKGRQAPCTARQRRRTRGHSDGPRVSPRRAHCCPSGEGQHRSAPLWIPYCTVRCIGSFHPPTMGAHNGRSSESRTKIFRLLKVICGEKTYSVCPSTISWHITPINCPDSLYIPHQTVVPGS